MRWFAALALLGMSARAEPPRTGDPTRGEAVYARCRACHDLEVDRTGPRHCGLLNRRAATVPGFTYSEALRRSGLVWTRATLDRFLQAPLEVVPGTFMTYAGVPDAQDRADVIAWLSAQRCPTKPAAAPATGRPP